MSKREKTVTRSFRISQSAFKGLEDDAARRNISVNTLVNQLFLVHTKWGRFFDEIGSIRISKSTFGRLLQASSDDAVVEASRLSGLDTPRAIIVAKHGTLSLSTVLDYVRSTSTYGGYAEYSEVETQGRLVITMMHNLGNKGSLFLSSILESIFGLVDCHPKITSSEHAVMIEL